MKKVKLNDLDSFMEEASKATRCSRLEKIGEIVGISLSIGTKGASVRIGIHCVVHSKTLHQIQYINPSSRSH